MCEAIEFDRFVGVFISRNREAGVVGDVDLLLLDYDVLFHPTTSRVISLLLHDVVSMGSVIAVVCCLFDHQPLL